MKLYCKYTSWPPLLDVLGPSNSAHFTIQVALLSTYSASSPINHNPAISQAIWINCLENARADINIILAAAFASIDDGGLVRDARGGVEDVDRSAADGVVVRVGRVVHYLCG